MNRKIKVKEIVNGLEKPLCQKENSVAVGGYQDNLIDGVTYRVWSAFEGQTDAEQSLENLMLRKLESGEDVGEVHDDYEEMLERKGKESEMDSQDEAICFVL